MNETVGEIGKTFVSTAWRGVWQGGLFAAVIFVLFKTVRAPPAARAWPAIADAVLWFFPLARLSRREYAQAREEACDRQALVLTGAAPGSYGQLLLTFGLARRSIDVSAACGASPHFHHLERRLLRLQDRFTSAGTRAWGLVLALGVCALIPVRVAARERVVESSTAQWPDQPTQELDRRKQEWARRWQELDRNQQEIDRAILSAEAEHGSLQQREGRRGSDPSARDDAYILVRGRRTTMSGSDADFERVKALTQRFGDHLLWLRRDSREYVVTDEQSLQTVNQLLEPQDAQNRRQAELGDRQAELGKKQGALGQRQAELGYTQQSGRDQAEVNRQQDEINREQRTINREQDVINRKQDAINKDQNELTGALEANLRALFDALIAKGSAKPASTGE